MRRLLIRPGAIGDFILSLPALESLRGDYTEVWCAEQNAPLVHFADAAHSIGATGLDRLGLLPADDVIARLRTFDSIVSWYGAANAQFRAFTESLRLPIEFRKALPDGIRHAVEFYGGHSSLPRIPTPDVARTFAAIHPFASSEAKRAPRALFQRVADQLSASMPVHWLCGPEEELAGAIRIANLYDLACWLKGARIFVGNDSGISHLAAAVGTPVLALFRNTNPVLWSPRGPSSYSILIPTESGSEFRAAPEA